MANILFVPNILFEVLTTSFENEGFDLLMTIGVDECRKVFSVGEGGEGAERGCGADVWSVIGYVDCSCLGHAG